jgi:diaminopimelate epimerase
MKVSSAAIPERSPMLEAMRFTKMQGLGNDYVYVDAFVEKVGDPAAVARFVGDRRFGIGSDGLILIHPSKTADFRMEMYNADGSRGEMCGNGIRCCAKYVYEQGHARRAHLTAETDAGPKELDLVIRDGSVTAVRVNMGAPILERSRIPMLGPEGSVVAEQLAVQDHAFTVTAVSMGNPHCVLFVEDPDRFPVERVGRAIEHLPVFPRRTNVEFVKVLSRTEVVQRTWERGSGETSACGTGACAVVVAGRLNGLLDAKVTVHLKGGDLAIEWEGGDAPVMKTGPAVEVFRGEIALPA